MALLAEVIIPKMFDSIQAPIIKTNSPYEGDHLYSHYCQDCGQIFLARWDYRNNMGFQIWNGNQYTCPRCGIQVSGQKGAIADVGGSAPVDMKIRLYEFKEHIALKVQYRAITFDSEGSKAYIRPEIETFKFNIKRRTSYFETAGGELYEFANPLDNEMVEKSALAYLKHNSCAWHTHKKEINILLAKLRSCLAKKAKHILGLEIKATFAPAGSELGLMLFPLQNIAWRLAVPDAPNISTALNGKAARKGVGQLQLWVDENFRLETYGYFEKVILLAKKGKSYPQSALEAAEIPDRKAFRRIMAQGSIFEIGRLHTAYTMTENYQEQLNIYRFLATKQEVPSYSWRSMYSCYPEYTDSMLRFSQHISKLYGPGAVYRMIKLMPLSDIRDSASMHKKLEGCAKINWTVDKPAISKLHDYLVEMWTKYQHADYSLLVPEHVIKRLEMQKDRLKFFLPKTAHELNGVGKTLHNCVGSYANNVLNGKCAVVAMTDDEGKLLVCIEIREGAIWQAKLNQNRPVANNSELNAAVLDWAEKTKLEVATSDINTAETDNKELRNVI